MSKNLEFTDRLVLSVLANDLNLSQTRLDLILKTYPSLKKATEDKFEIFSSLFSEQSLKKHSKETNSQLSFLEEDYPKTQNLITKAWLGKIQNYNWNELDGKISKLDQELTQNQIQILFYQDFPKSIQDLADAPCLLYFQGDLSCFELKKNIAVVGSRQISTYTTRVLNTILPELTQVDLGIVSGLALGVDSLAHKLSLNTRSKCIAFIGSGLDEASFYPSQNKFLKREILENNGLICSEYPPGFQSMPYTFPRRNRFVASLSDITWVVQASSKSGALITAKLAMDFGKTVATTPSSIFDSSFDGNLELIKDGAQIISQSSDLFGLLNLSISLPTQPNLSQNIDWGLFSSIAKIIFEKLNFEPQELQDIFLATKIPIPNLNTELSLLELAGLVENLGGGLWVRK
jgi:DNA processing protein